MENPPSVIVKEGRHRWKTAAERLESLGLSGERYGSLHANFNACIGINKMRIIREEPDKEIFAGEVQTWLHVELTAEDRRKIYGRDNLPYHPGFAMYSAMAHFKSRYMTKIQNAERRRLENAAGAAAVVAAAVAAELAAGVAAEIAAAAAAAELAAGVAAIADAARGEAEEDAEPEAEPEADSPVPASPGPSIRSENGRYQNSPHMENDFLHPSPQANQASRSPSADSPHIPNAPHSPDADEQVDDHEMHPLSSPSFSPAPAAGGQFREDDSPISPVENISPFAGTPRSETPSSSAIPSPAPGPLDEDLAMLELESHPHPRPAKRDLAPDESPLVLKRMRIAERPPTLLSIRAKVDLLIHQAIALSSESDGHKLQHRYARVRELFVPAPELPRAIMVAKSADADRTAARFINYHIRIRGSMAPVQHILDRGTPSFQHIWTPDARNSDIARPFRDQLAASFPVCLVATGYSAGGKTYSLLMPNEADPPVLEVLLKQALETEGQLAPLDVTVHTMLASKTVKVLDQIATPPDIGVFLEKLQTPGVGADNGINQASSRRHVLIEVRAGVKRVLSVLDLCGDESSDIREGPLRVESDAIAKDLVALRTLVMDKFQKRNNAGLPIPGNGRGRDLTRRFVDQLPHFEKINFIFFCNGGGEAGSVSKLCGEWTAKKVGSEAGGAGSKGRK